MSYVNGVNVSEWNMLQRRRRRWWDIPSSRKIFFRKMIRRWNLRVTDDRRQCRVSSSNNDIHSLTTAMSRKIDELIVGLQESKVWEIANLLRIWIFWVINMKMLMTQKISCVSTLRYCHVWQNVGMYWSWDCTTTPVHQKVEKKLTCQAQHCASVMGSVTGIEFIAIVYLKYDIRSAYL